jgi:hypothetical protein
MIAANGLHRSAYLIERCVIEDWSQCTQFAEKRMRLLGHDAPSPFANKQRIQNLYRPKRRNERLIATF